MNTTSNLSAGHESGPVPSSVSPTAVDAAVHPRHHTGGTRSRKAWLYRRIMKSGAVEPFRKVLRPLIHWVLKPHLGVHDEADKTVPVLLKKPSTFTVVMTAILAPVVFVILLPLIVVLLPAALIIGTIAVLVPVFTGEMEEGVQHETFATHVMH